MVDEVKKIGVVTPLKLRMKWKQPKEYFVVNSAYTQLHMIEFLFVSGDRLGCNLHIV